MLCFFKTSNYVLLEKKKISFKSKHKPWAGEKDPMVQLQTFTTNDNLLKNNWFDYN